MTQASVKRVKFASQMEPDLYEDLKSVAQEDGRQIQAVLEDAVRVYIENRKRPMARRHVLDALEVSMIEHDALYKELAK